MLISPLFHVICIFFSSEILLRDSFWYFWSFWLLQHVRKPQIIPFIYSPWVVVHFFLICEVNLIVFKVVLVGTSLWINWCQNECFGVDQIRLEAVSEGLRCVGGFSLFKLLFCCLYKCLCCLQVAKGFPAATFVSCLEEIASDNNIPCFKCCVPIKCTRMRKQDQKVCLFCCKNCLFYCKQPK